VIELPIFDLLFRLSRLTRQWTLILGFVFAQTCWGQTPGVERAKAVMEGNWRLEEWRVDEETLRPPQADGRLSRHGGVTMVLMHRDSQGTRKSFYGYGTYSFTDDTYTYGYDRYVTFTDNGSAIAAGKGPFEGRRTYQMRFEGEKLILDNDNGRWMSIYEGDTRTYFDNGKPLRKWRKMPAD
jgi:hypothetical protein